MRSRIQLGLLKLADPWVVRVLLVGLTLALTLLPGGSVVHANVCPDGGGTGCGGG